MVKIEVLDGPVYQWDTGRKVKVVGENVTEVHFSSVYSENAYVTEPTEGIVSIPSVLLQSGTNILVYVVSANEDGEQTIARKTVYVNKRSKPDDYIYTEDEVFTFKQLEERVTYLEEHGSTGGGAASGTVEDVKVNGTSIVNEGVADIPMASATQHGIGKAMGYVYGIDIKGDNCFAILKAPNEEIDKRAGAYKPIVASNLDYAVKQAMCDGKGAEWTSEEKASARDRFGIDLTPMLDAPLVIEEDLVGAMNIELPTPCEQVLMLVKQPQNTTSITLYSGVIFEDQYSTGAGSLMGYATTKPNGLVSYKLTVLNDGIVESVTSNTSGVVNQMYSQFANQVGKKIAKVGLSSISATLPKGTEIMVLGK